MIADLLARVLLLCFPLSTPYIVAESPHFDTAKTFRSYHHALDCLSDTFLVLCIAQEQPTLLHDHHQEFGIGFELTPSYATAAASFANGSNVALARLDGNTAWRKLMADLSWDEQGNLWEPADSHVSIITNMLLELTNACELRLGQRPTAAAVSMPSRNIVAHQTTPVADLLKTAFSAANLDYLEIVHYSLFGEPLLYPENVQLAGHSLGLCQPYTSSDHCLEDDDQLRNLTSEVYYLVGYYSGALEAIATTPTALAYGITPDPYPDYRLGANARNDNPDEDFYWQEVRRLLSKPFIRGMIRNPSKIVMYGDHGKDERLTAMVDEIFASFLGDQDMPTWVEDGVDAVFAGAMGAAEFAKRKPYWGLDVVTEGASVVLPKNDL